MDIKLIRDTFAEDYTLGEVRIGGTRFCYSVEDKVRETNETKVFGKTAIPYGTYEVQMTMSNRFKVLMPLLVGVPGFEGVRIHSGNTSADTEGCLILGYQRTANGVAESRLACAEMYNQIEYAIKLGQKVTIEITK